MKKETDNGVFSIIFGAVGKYIRENYSVLILMSLTFLAAVAISFVQITTTATVASFDINEYEVGQIADKTISATKSIPADFENPISVEKDEKVIRKGFPITEEGYAKLRKMSESPIYVDYRAFANAVIFHILMVSLFFILSSRIYFQNQKLEFKEVLTECVFYILIFATTIFGTKTVYFSSSFSLCSIIPSVFCVYLVAILFGQINAVFFSIMISLCVFNASAYRVVPFFFTLASALSAARIVRKIERRTDIVFASLLQALLNVVFLIIFKIVFNSPLSEDFWTIFGVALTGFFSGILCLGMLTPLELMLNTASPFRLMDLADQNSPVMQKMLLTAGGTHSHSLMVAQLAESACNAVGANALLARVGAFFHDIGKMDNPEYFVENQASGENLHNSINPSLSVSVIRSHVKRGVEKAHSLRLPSRVIDIINEHHGNQVIAYFYNEAKKIDPYASPEDYSYNGNPPSSKESAIVMLADTVEAACRSLDKPSVPRLDKFISDLFEGKIASHQLDGCNLTFNDLTKIHDSFVNILASHYHSRTKYPDQKDPDGPEPQEQKSQDDDADKEKFSEATEKESREKDSKETKETKSAKKTSSKEKVNG